MSYEGIGSFSFLSSSSFSMLIEFSEGKEFGLGTSC